jgi:hypothetical protein
LNFPTFKYVFTPENFTESCDLRGDPELWRYLGAVLYQVPIPRDAKIALQVVKDLITNFTGWDCATTTDESFRVSLSHFQSGSGMSTGASSTRWWTEQAFPLVETLIAHELQEYERLSSDIG